MNMSTNLNQLFKDNIEFHYMCSLCDSIFMSKSEYSDHSNKCCGSKQKSNRQKLSIEPVEIPNTNQCQKLTEEEICTSNMNGYEISGEILSENEVLITLKQNVTNSQATNNVSLDTDLITIPQAIDASSQSSNQTVVIENANVDLDSDDSNVKILTVLDPVDLNKTIEDTNTTEQNLADTGKESEEFLKGVKLIVNEALKQKIGSCKPIKRQCNLKEKSKNTSQPKNNTSSRMYRVIPQESKSQPTYGVYDFYDEEEEMLKQKKLEEKRKVKELKSRTCKFCNTVFEDPIDLLRHKREKHIFNRVLLSRKELEPYLKAADKTQCPLCKKPIGTTNYKTAYMRHILTHSSEYDFRCRVCEQPFRRKDQWLSHEKRHIVQPN
ncbi:uncharacterized protein LOC143193786 isoform X2 [Rhynchophorus ferrugineus]|uniref:uncharacterized protein LOC143193786 isoform X2 n=1 Tax=Rhynchophorus ferrugineus TaxID=354439 RepID=UPI003FCC29EC